LISHVQQSERDEDAFLLELSAGANYFERALSFMNDYRASSPYTGVMRPATASFDPAATPYRQLLSRYRRLWLMTEGVPPGDPNSRTERWYNEHAYLLTDRWYGKTLRLLLYSLPAKNPAPLLDTEMKTNFAEEPIRLVHSTLSVAEGKRPTHPLRVQPGDTLQLELIWETTRPPSANLKISVQLLEGTGHLRLQEDRFPVGGFRPASSWKPDEQIVDRYGLPLPGDLPRGRYTLIAGLYFPENGRRVHTIEGADHVQISELIVEPPGTWFPNE